MIYWFICNSCHVIMVNQMPRTRSRKHHPNITKIPAEKNPVNVVDSLQTLYLQQTNMKFP